MPSKNILLVILLLSIIFLSPVYARGPDKITDFSSATVLYYNNRPGTALNLIGIRIVPEYNDYVMKLYKYYLKGRVVTIIPGLKKYSPAGMMVYLYCPTTGFYFSMRSAYYNQIVDKKKGLFLNAYLVSQGLAVPQSYPKDTTHDELFKKLYEEAKQNRLGAWKTLGKKIIKSSPYQSSSGSSKPLLPPLPPKQ